MTQQNSHGNQIQDIPQTGFFGHPRGLGVLFFVEFWKGLVIMACVPYSFSTCTLP
ncbi:hypothetical protein HIK86_13420 [Staphylococcus aureus]|nr:hypothetical protein HIK86_13420 [Staphylococcus aureus]